MRVWQGREAAVGLELEGSFLLALGGCLACLLSPVTKGLHGRSQRVVAHGPGLRGRGEVSRPLRKLSAPVHSSVPPPPPAPHRLGRARDAEVAGLGALGRCVGYEGSSGRDPAFPSASAVIVLWAPPEVSGPLSVAPKSNAKVRSARIPAAAPKRGATQRCFVSSSDHWPQRRHPRPSRPTPGARIS